MAKNQVIEVGSVIELQDKTGELEFNLKQLKAVRNELTNLSLDLDNSSEGGWNGQNSILIIGDVEDKINLLMLSVNAIYSNLKGTISEIKENTDELYNAINPTNTIKAIS